MKRILIVVPELTFTGSLFSSKRICKVLIEAGYEVNVWSLQKGKFEKEFRKLGILPKIIDKNDIYENKSLIGDLNGYDLLISNTINTYAIADLAKNIIPTIWYIREAQNLPWQFFRTDIRKYYALLRAENLYVVSEYARDFIKESYFLDCRVLHNCVEDESKLYELVERKHENIRFLALGTLEARKDFDVYIKAYLSLSYKEKEECEIHFAGNSIDCAKGYYNSLLKLIENEKGICYHGEIQERKELLQLIKDSDVIVVPSKDESCSLVVLEAAMMSKPLIISENIGAKYMVSSDNGWIFETGNIEELTNVYRDVLNKRQWLHKMGQISRKKYLKMADYETYRKNILKMVSDNLSDNIEKYQMEHKSKAEREKKQRWMESKMKLIQSFNGLECLDGHRVAIYAAGMVGQAFFCWCKEREYKVVAWVDKNWMLYQEKNDFAFSIENPEKLNTVNCDAVCIAVNKKLLADEIKRELVELGIQSWKIIWAKPKRYAF